MGWGGEERERAAHSLVKGRRKEERREGGRVLARLARLLDCLPSPLLLLPIVLKPLTNA